MLETKEKEKVIVVVIVFTSCITMTIHQVTSRWLLVLMFHKNTEILDFLC